jgi:gliding motility-associated protein GldM
MAGGKETPRQKMIGMMYLVLTALLALQVSSAIIDKFVILNESIEYAVRESVERSQSTLETIKNSVKERGSKPIELEVVRKADLVRGETDKLLSYINKLKDELIEKSGGREDDGKTFKGAKEEDAVAIHMVGPGETKSGEAYKLQKMLNDYAAKMTEMSLSKKFDKLAKDGKEDPLFKDNAEQKNKDFAKLNFENTPMVAALAVLSELQSKVTNIEADLLGDLKSQVGAADFKFDLVLPMVKPESKIVAAGTKYKAEMFVGARDSKMIPKMRFGGKELSVTDGKGLVEFTAQGGSYDAEGNFKTKWKGEITIPKPTGGDTTLMIEEEYIVAKPVIQIQSASVSALYLNCGNELNVQVPALGSVYNPKFQGSGADFIAGGKKGLVTIVPNAPQVVLKVYSDGNFIGEQSFKVKPIPKPSIDVLSSGKKIDLKNGVKMPGPRTITVQAVPEEGFKTLNEKDARYLVAEYIVTLARGSRAVTSQKSTQPTVDLGAFASQARPNDRILIEINSVKRKNFREAIEEVPGMKQYINIPISE